MFNVTFRDDFFTVGKTVCKVVVLRNQHSGETESSAEEKQPELIVFLVEKPDNPGRSVTNAIEVLAQTIFEGIALPIGIKPWEICWVECYVDQEPITMEVVTFKHDREIGADVNWENPQWKTIVSFSEGVQE